MTLKTLNNSTMRVIIIGGVAAGAKAAAKTKRLLPDSDVPIYTKDLTKPIYVVLVVDKNEEYEYMKILKDEYSVLIDEKTGLLEF